MGITQVEPREAERFEEGIEPEFQDAEETVTRENSDSAQELMSLGHSMGIRQCYLAGVFR